MIETFLIALFAMLVALYVQARKAAREIRKHREENGIATLGTIILDPAD